MYKFFIQRVIAMNLLFVGQQDAINNWELCSKISRDCRKVLMTKIAQQYHWEKFIKLSLHDRPICFSEIVRFIRLACFPYASSFPPRASFSSCYQYPTIFSWFTSPHFKQLSWIFSSLNNHCNFWGSESWQVGIRKFCRWGDLFAQKWISRSPNIMCKCNESPSALATKTSIECIL